MEAQAGAHGTGVQEGRENSLCTEGFMEEGTEAWAEFWPRKRKAF